MFKNYLITAWRFLKQNKIFAGINVMGLSIAMAASFIILLYVINEMSYDRCHKNRKQIFRVLNYYVEFKNTQLGTPYILATALKDEFPQIEKSVRARYMRGFMLKVKDEFISVPYPVATDSEIFDIFTLPLTGKTPDNNLLDDLNSIVLSREMAEKIFPGDNPVGRDIIGIANGKEHLFTVKAVFENIPDNSTFRAQCFVNSRWTIEPINTTFKVNNADANWTLDFWTTWILLSENSNPETIESQLRDFEIKNISEKPHVNYSLQNLSDVYLGSDDVSNSGIRGNIKNVRLFSAIAILIVLVATINYIILSTAVSSGRGKEIGIRKTMGAGINSIRKQLFSESVLLAMLVLPIAIIFMSLSIKYAGRLFQTDLKIISSNVLTYTIVYLTFTFIIGLISGIYTSAYLSKLKIVGILKTTTYMGKKKLMFRSLLITLQLVIFCSFVSATLIIRSQYQYALNKDPGYLTKDILLIDLGRDFKGYSSYINNIRSNPNVIMAAGVMEGLPMRGSMASMYPNFENEEVKVKVEGLAVDYNFINTMGITILEGREFSEDFGTDLTQSAILNEQAVKQLGITDPVGKLIGNQTIIGVVKDFNLHSLHTDIPPLIINMTDRYIQQVAVHYKTGSLNSILPMLESEWEKAAPGQPFRYNTIEDITKSLYSSEKNLSTIVSIFAIFTLLIAAFGLFGLILFVARTRVKEIGIKKVFGSSGQSIIFSFLKDNFTLVTVAALISVPVTIYFMNDWLNNFAYKTKINWYFFAVAYLIAAIVVLLTVFFHSYRASRINPVKALRYE